MPIYSQSNEDTKAPNYASPSSNYEYTGQNDLPKGFNDIELGSDMENVKAQLKEDGLFIYREPDFYPFTSTSARSLTVRGTSFIDNAYFVFSEDLLLISISLFLDSTYLDYSTMYQQLEEKYGRPQLQTNIAIWIQGDVSLILEKPLHIKYINNAVVGNATSTEEARTLSQSRQKFLELF